MSEIRLTPGACRGMLEAEQGDLSSWTPRLQCISIKQLPMAAGSFAARYRCALHIRLTALGEISHHNYGSQLDSFGWRVLHAGNAQHAAQSSAREPRDPEIFHLQDYSDSQQFGAKQEVSSLAVSCGVAHPHVMSTSR